MFHTGQLPTQQGHGLHAVFNTFTIHLFLPGNAPLGEPLLAVEFPPVDHPGGSSLLGGLVIVQLPVQGLIRRVGIQRGEAYFRGVVRMYTGEKVLHKPAAGGDAGLFFRQQADGHIAKMISVVDIAAMGFQRRPARIFGTHLHGARFAAHRTAQHAAGFRLPHPIVIRLRIGFHKRTIPLQGDFYIFGA
ncbi:MAG: hypothetical protein BWX80_02266 [Candidatus Hydrogenedentes bacterium ADurb.Bin101]|nr:MAG: hypothetical protein BWX80_02266 [Candidatus Hydrogenedentes bacterium ADurb.Bin101]